MKADYLALIVLAIFGIGSVLGFYIKIFKFRIHHSIIGIGLAILGYFMNSVLLILIGLLILAHHIVVEGFI